MYNFFLNYLSKLKYFIYYSKYIGLIYFFFQCSRPKKEPSPVEESEKISVQMVQYATTTTRGTLRSLSAQPSSPNELLLRSPRANFE